MIIVFAEKSIEKDYTSNFRKKYVIQYCMDIDNKWVLLFLNQYWNIKL